VQNIKGFTVNKNECIVEFVDADGSPVYYSDFTEVYKYGRWIRIIDNIRTDGLCIFTFENELLTDDSDYF